MCVRVCVFIYNRERESTGHISNTVYLPCGGLSWGWERNLSCFQLIFSGRIYVRIYVHVVVVAPCWFTSGRTSLFTLIHAKGSLRSFYSRPHFTWQPISDIILRRRTSHYLLLKQTKPDGKDGAAIQWCFKSAPSSVNCGRQDLCDGKNGAITLNTSDYSWCSTSSCSSLQIYSSSEWKVNLLSTVCHWIKEIFSAIYLNLQ